MINGKKEDGRYDIVSSFTDEEIEAFRQDDLRAKKLEAKADKQKALEEFIGEKNLSVDDLNDPETHAQITAEFEKEYEITSEEPNPKEPYSVYHSVGQMEMVMAMVSKLMEDFVIVNNPDYFNQAHKAHDALFNMQQMMVGDWFELKD